MSGLAGEAESGEHQRLVKALIDQFIFDGLEILNAAYQGYEKPYKIGRHEPDIIAQNPKTEVVSIGEAKVCADLESEKTQEQFEDFSNRQMAVGTTKNVAVPFHILTPPTCAHTVWTVLFKLSLDKRNNIVVWQPRPEGLETVYSEVAIKNIEVRSVSADGTVTVVVHLEGNADANFIYWFRDPTPHSSIRAFDTRACKVTINTIHFSVAQRSLKSAVSLIKEWVPIASKYAREKYEELHGKETRDQELDEKLKKRRQELQDEIDKLR